MIVTKEKEWDVIKKYLKDYKNIALVGCGACAAACQTGGKDDVERMARKLSEEGHVITCKAVVDESCHHMLTRKQLRDYKESLKNTDCILAMSCGAGVQCLAELFDEKKVMPANDTHILGNVVRTGHFKNYCSMCGDCILAETEGVCVKTRCPKNNVNGPCGGMFNGKCEVYPDNDCVFVMIYNKKKENKAYLEKQAFHKKDFSKKIDELKLPRKR